MYPRVLSSIYKKFIATSAIGLASFSSVLAATPPSTPLDLMSAGLQTTKAITQVVKNTSSLAARMMYLSGDNALKSHLSQAYTAATSFAFSAAKTTFSFATQRSTVMTLGKISAIAGLSAFGVPAWAAAPLMFGTDNIAKGISMSAGAHVLSKGALTALDLWAPSLSHGSLGSLSYIAFPLAASIASKAIVNTGLSGLKTGWEYAKKNPVKALAAGTVAAAAVYYGAPILKEALFKLGDGPLSVTKAIVDNGSGAIKATAQTYNPFTQQTLKEWELGKHAISLSQTMHKVEGTLRLDPVTMKQAASAVTSLVEKAKEAGIHPSHITGVATAWARSGAANVSEYLDMVKAESGVSLHIATQVDEGKLGLLAAKAQGVDTSQQVVLDTGGGSLQLTGVKEQSLIERFTSGSDQAEVYGTETASATFNKEAQRIISGMAQSPNPYNIYNLMQLRNTEHDRGLEWTQSMFRNLAQAAKSYTLEKNTADTGMEILDSLRGSVSKQGGNVVGIGNVYGGTLKLLRFFSPKYETLTKEGLDHAMHVFSGRTTQEIGGIIQQAGLPPSIAENVATNLPLIKGIMEAFNIEHIQVVNANSGAAALFYEKFWTTGYESVKNMVNSTALAVGTQLNKWQGKK